MVQDKTILLKNISKFESPLTKYIKISGQDESIEMIIINMQNLFIFLYFFPEYGNLLSSSCKLLRINDSFW